MSLAADRSSYYFGVWEGPAPLSNVHASSEFERRMASRTQDPATPGIHRLIDRLLAVHPDPDLPEGEEGPWNDGPLLNCAQGSLLCLAVRPERVDDVAALVEVEAASLGLVAFDPQLGELMPSATTVARTAEFELPQATDVPIHLRALMDEALRAPTALAGIVEEVATEFYVQWMGKAGGLVVEAQGEGLVPPELRLGPVERQRMLELGFAEADPNWAIRWADGHANLDRAAAILAEVITRIRRIPVGAAMRLHTFPL